MVRFHLQVVAHRRGNDACALTGRLLGDEVGNDAVVLVVEVAHRLVEQDEVAGLAQGADNGHTLLLADGQFAGQAVHLVGNAHRFKQPQDLVAAFKSRDAVLEFHVLHRGEFAEQAHVLCQIGDVPLSHVTPLGDGQPEDVFAVEGDGAAVVLSVAIDVTAHR